MYHYTRVHCFNYLQCYCSSKFKCMHNSFDMRTTSALDRWWTTSRTSRESVATTRAIRTTCQRNLYNLIFDYSCTGFEMGLMAKRYRKRICHINAVIGTTATGMSESLCDYTGSLSHRELCSHYDLECSLLSPQRHRMVKTTTTSQFPQGG